METEATPRPAVAEGQVIDGFLVGPLLHQGGMARLWSVTRVAAREPALPAEGDAELPLIMKVPRIKGGDDPATIVGFEVEQMILPLLTGVHVPRFVARGDFAVQPYIVMERIAGDSLKARFDAAPLPAAEVADIGARVATALHDLHLQHVVHLDVKPSNVLFRPSGDAVLVDFGLSRHDRLPDLLEEEFELPLGTSPYMSPEQVHYVRRDPRSDLFALGVLMYHLLTGQRPFGAPTTVRGLRQRLYRDPVPPRALLADCPPWLQEIILRCLEVQPEKRHQSAAQLAFDLQNPEQVVLTPRAERRARGGPLGSMRRWFKAIGAEPELRGGTDEQTSRSAIVLAAIDVANAEPELLETLCLSVQRVLQTHPAARLACLAIMKTHLIGLDELVERDGSSKHVNLLVQLRHWARPIVKTLALDRREQDARITFHVIEAPDPAMAIVEYARKNQVDQIVMGARSSSAWRRYLGSVSAQVVAQAPCSVTVVRVRGASE
jgi:nucleotide-binding universal stress UspA family protein